MKKTQAELRAALMEAMAGGDDKQIEAAFNDFAEGLQDAIIAKAMNLVEEKTNDGVDENILVNRGTIKALTSEEKKFYNAVIRRDGFDGIDMAFPQTIIQDILNKIKTEHPLLSLVDVQPTSILARVLFAADNKALAFWGPICEDIKQIILAGLHNVDLKASRLSGFVPVCKGMLSIGVDWLATYVENLLYEIISAGLETAIINGDGKDKPIGMMRALSGATDGVYPAKAETKLKTLDEKSLAGIAAALAEAHMHTSGTCAIVNPVTYYAKVFGAVAYRIQDGSFDFRLATGEKVLQSYAVPKDKIVVGDPKNYLLGVAQDISIDKYTETLAIEDMDLYIAKMYAAGCAKDPNAFFVVDISGVSGVDVPKLEEWKKNIVTGG